jgi:hypothetical protein
VNRAMKQWSLILLAALPAGLAALGWTAAVSAQTMPETVEAINQARIVSRILFITAHPDDEMSSLLPYLSRGLSADVALLTITRGEAGRMPSGRSRTASLEPSARPNCWQPAGTTACINISRGRSTPVFRNPPRRP